MVGVCQATDSFEPTQCNIGSCSRHGVLKIMPVSAGNHKQGHLTRAAHAAGRSNRKAILAKTSHFSACRRQRPRCRCSAQRDSRSQSSPHRPGQGHTAGAESKLGLGDGLCVRRRRYNERAQMEEFQRDYARGLQLIGDETAGPPSCRAAQGRVPRRRPWKSGIPDGTTRSRVYDHQGTGSCTPEADRAAVQASPCLPV